MLWTEHGTEGRKATIAGSRYQKSCLVCVDWTHSTWRILMLDRWLICPASLGTQDLNWGWSRPVWGYVFISERRETSMMRIIGCLLHAAHWDRAHVPLTGTKPRTFGFPGLRSIHWPKLTKVIFFFIFREGGEVRNQYTLTGDWTENQVCALWELNP